VTGQQIRVFGVVGGVVVGGEVCVCGWGGGLAGVLGREGMCACVRALVCGRGCVCVFFMILSVPCVDRCPNSCLWRFQLGLLGATHRRLMSWCSTLASTTT
jgi:hypothetical protein